MTTYNIDKAKEALHTLKGIRSDLTVKDYHLVNEMIFDLSGAIGDPSHVGRNSRIHLAIHKIGKKGMKVKEHNAREEVLSALDILVNSKIE